MVRSSLWISSGASTGFCNQIFLTFATAGPFVHFLATRIPVPLREENRHVQNELFRLLFIPLRPFSGMLGTEAKRSVGQQHRPPQEE